MHQKHINKVFAQSTYLDTCIQEWNISIIIGLEFLENALIKNKDFVLIYEENRVKRKEVEGKP